MSLPNPDEGESKAISAYVRFDGQSGWDEWDTYFYHPHSGELHAAHLQENKTLGAKWRNSNYKIHVGAIYGLPTKILAFLASLFCASFPVTGFLIWWGRRKKKSKKTARSTKHRKTRKKAEQLTPVV